MNRRLFTAFCATVIVASGMAIGVPNAVAKDSETRMTARLSGVGSQRLASGKAVYRKRGNRVRFTAEVEDLRGVSRVRVIVGGQAAGTARVIAGTADLNLRGARVPNVRKGMAVRVVDVSSGRTVARGQF